MRGCAQRTPVHGNGRSRSEPRRFAGVGVQQAAQAYPKRSRRVGVEQVTDSKRRVTPISAFDGAGLQWERSRLIPFDAGVKLPGAFLFIQSASAYPRKPHQIGHVAMLLCVVAWPPRYEGRVSLGNGYLLEARGCAYGVTIGPVRPSFNLATKISELYTPAVLG